MPIPDVSGKRILLHVHLVLEERDHLARALGLRLPLDAGVDVLGVLAEDDHVGLRRVLERARYAAEVPHRAQADIEVELLPERDVQRADTAADRRRHRALDRDRELLHGLERLLRQPDVLAVEPRRLLAGVDLHPADLALARIRLLDGRVDDVLHHGGDVDPDPVALDERDDRIRGHGLAGDDLLAARRLRDVGHGAHWCSLGRSVGETGNLCEGRYAAPTICGGMSPAPHLRADRLFKLRGGGGRRRALRERRRNYSLGSFLTGPVVTDRTRRDAGAVGRASGRRSPW